MSKVIILFIAFILVSGCVSQSSEIKDVAQKTINQVKGKFLDLPDCSEIKYSVTPVNLDKVDSITPLGNLAPPDHTLPTQHMYFHLSETRVPLSAPTDIVITRLSSNEDLVRGYKDYGMQFALCDDVNGYFLHIKELNPEIKAELDNSRCFEYGNYISCDTGASIQLKAGDLIGYVSDENQMNFDFGAYDYRNELEYANPSRYTSRGKYIVCPLDFYDEENRKALYTKLESTDSNCGSVNQDVTRTLQGNWFFGDSDEVREWTEHLAFVHSNTDSSKQVISIGGVFTNPGRWIFDPIDSGLVNRDFSQVTSDGNIYCYETDRNNGIIIVELTSNTEIQIEHKQESCQDSLEFSNPTVYSR